jgi:hypothetical protein
MIDRSTHGPQFRRVARCGLAVAVPLLLLAGAVHAEAQFERASIYLERNIADDDIEVRFVVTAEEGGFAALRVSGPDGRTLIDFKSPDSKLGIRHLDLESPEPRDKATVLADFPEGTYRFEGTLADGDTVQAEATLKHTFPSAPTLSTPRSGQTELPVKGAKVRWEPASDAASLEVVLKETKGARQMRVTLLGGATTFAIPDGFLVPGAKYEVAVGAIHEGGNRSYQEIEFTAQKR